MSDVYRRTLQATVVVALLMAVISVALSITLGSPVALPWAAVSGAAVWYARNRLTSLSEA